MMIKKLLSAMQENIKYIKNNQLEYNYNINANFHDEYKLKI